MNGDGAIDLMVDTATSLSGGNGVIFGQTGSLTTQLNGDSFASAATNGPAVFKFTSDNGTAGIGDINNDGFIDVITATGSTTASVRLGGATTDNVADQNLSLGIGYSTTGNPVVADFNGDGHADLFMSAANSSAVNGASATSPALAMWLGNSNGSGIANTPTATAYSGITPVGVSSLFNAAYALGATDLNGDGYADIVTNVGAANDGQTNYGPIKVTFGNSAGNFALDMSSSAGGVLLSNFDVGGGNPLARVVAAGGDVNGDGKQDLLGWNEGGTGGFVLFGSTSYTAGNSVDIAALNGSTGVRFTGAGAAVTEMTAGDLNGDGIDDIVIASQTANSGAGKLWVVWGKQGGFNSGSIDLSTNNPVLFTTITGAASQGIGSALSITDMNGDGKNDLVVGSNSGTIDVVSGETFEGMLTTPLKCYSTFEDKPLTLSTAMLLGNDSDPDGDPLTIQSVQGAVGGTVAFDLDGNIVFTPTANHNGAASFTYTISDGNGGTDTATVNLTVKSDEMSLASVGVRAGSGLPSVNQLTFGDVNGDGAVDLLAAVGRTVGGSNGVLFGEAGSLATKLNGGDYASAAANGPAVFKLSPFEGVVGIGDVNNDGFDDTIQGITATTAGIRLGGTTPDNVTDQTISWGIGYGSTGTPLVADFNGDGYADLFVSVANSTAVNGSASATTPALALWLGGANGIANTPTATAYSGIEGVGVSSKFNMAVAMGVTDLNGDGYADIVTNVGARNDGQTNYGPAKVTFGNSSGSFAANMATAAGGLILNNFDVAGTDPLARAVASGGDANGDGMQDLLGWNETGAGGFALFGSTDYTADSSVNIAAFNGSNGVRFTGTDSAVTEMAVGDLNGDGIGDIVLGSQAANSGAGKLWVVWGKDGGFSSGSIDLSAE
ncbi:MAG: FG-GAP-like repeat-containing protein, partial [Ferrovibrio sp.]|uniref:cadherin-like domain-containing protein n=1 Tax=Ferrovibrio sp. TaxID=1917215 RepID=UPI0026272A8E